MKYVLLTNGQVFVKKARGQVLGEDGVRVHSMVLPGLTSSTSINFSGPGEVLLKLQSLTEKQLNWPHCSLFSDLHHTTWCHKCSMPNARISSGNPEGGTLEGNRHHTFSSILTRWHFTFLKINAPDKVIVSFAEPGLWPRKVPVVASWSCVSFLLECTDDGWSFLTARLCVKRHRKENSYFFY